MMAPRAKFVAVQPNRARQERRRAPGYRAHERCRSQRLAAVVAKEPVLAMLVLQARHVDIQVSASAIIPAAPVVQVLPLVGV
jgi:hypothetical protein